MKKYNTKYGNYIAFNQKERASMSNCIQEYLDEDDRVAIVNTKEYFDINGYQTSAKFNEKRIGKPFFNKKLFLSRSKAAEYKKILKERKDEK